MKDTTWK